MGYNHNNKNPVYVNNDIGIHDGIRMNPDNDMNNPAYVNNNQ